MVHQVSEAFERLVRELRTVVHEVDDSVLAPVSVAARTEWADLVRRLPLQADFWNSSARISEDELRRLLEKAVRFRKISASLAGESSAL